MTTQVRPDALKRIRAFFATEQAMAEAFAVTQPRQVWRWLNQSHQIPAEYVLRAEELTGVPRHLIRPDLYPLSCLPRPFAGTV
jgi:DNA-binding transcriptional regulator YdaS (Cro superfamily)